MAGSSERHGDDALALPCTSRRYVNQIDLSLSLSEVRIDFSQNFPNEAEPKTQCRLVTSPVHLRRMGSAMLNAIRTYQRKFGVIPSPDDEQRTGHG